MITSVIMRFLGVVISFIITMLGNIIPALDTEILISAVTYVSALVAYGFGIVCFFIPKVMFMAAIDSIFILMNFEYIYTFVMWIIRKIPGLGAS